MKKIILALFVFLQISFFYGHAQKKSLSVGDIVPDIEIQNIINYSSQTARISNFSGKLLILDFWATWCTPCLASFPKLAALKGKFGDKLQILAVTSEDKATVLKFLGNANKAINISIPPSVTGDDKLSRLFFHTTLPHYVWIDKDKKVIAITESKDVNDENITSYFQNGKFNYTLKEEESGIVVGSPVFAQGVFFEKDGVREFKKLDSSNLTIHSVLTKYVNGISSGGSFTPSNYLFHGNVSILSLYKTALYENGVRILNTSSSVLMVEITDSLLYKHITSIGLDGKRPRSGLESLAWLQQNAYCYELEVPVSLENQKHKIMLNELNLYFGAIYGIEGLIEKRINKYLALIRTSDINKLESKGNKTEINAGPLSLNIQNSTISKMINRLIIPLQSYPMLEDETGYTGKIDIQLNCELGNLKALNKELAKYDLQIVEKEKLMDVAVIRMKQNK